MWNVSCENSIASSGAHPLDMALPNMLFWWFDSLHLDRSNASIYFIWYYNVPLSITLRSQVTYGLKVLRPQLIYLPHGLMLVIWLDFSSDKTFHSRLLVETIYAWIGKHECMWIDENILPPSSLTHMGLPYSFCIVRLLTYLDFIIGLLSWPLHCVELWMVQRRLEALIFSSVTSNFVAVCKCTIIQET